MHLFQVVLLLLLSLATCADIRALPSLQALPNNVRTCGLDA